jgi:hypothetical protein
MFYSFADLVTEHIHHDLANNEEEYAESDVP